MKITVEVAFEIGDVVFLRMREERLGGLVTRFMVGRGGVTYAVTWGNGSETWHYAFELSIEHIPDFVT